MAIYALWRFIRFRMDSYIAANPLPSGRRGRSPRRTVKGGGVAVANADAAAAGHLRATILVVGGLLVLSELGVNITPLIAGASVFGLAVSFGSQSLVRDIVSGVFFLAEDSFRIGSMSTAARSRARSRASACAR